MLLKANSRSKNEFVNNAVFLYITKVMLENILEIIISQPYLKIVEGGLHKSEAKELKYI